MLRCVMEEFDKKSLKCAAFASLIKKTNVCAELVCCIPVMGLLKSKSVPLNCVVLKCYIEVCASLPQR